MMRAVRARLGSATLAGMVALAALFLVGWDAATRMLPAHGTLIAAEPPANALLADAPGEIRLTFSEPIAEERLHLLGAGGVEVGLQQDNGDTENASQITARPSGILGGGDYTVIWTARSVSDGSLLAGAYPFRSGVVTNPGAAQRDWQWPVPWSTLLRALVFFGTSLAAGGFGWSLLLASGSGVRRPPSLLRGAAVVGGALLALLATLLPPLLQPFIFPPREETVAITAALRAMPLGWWLQLIALATLVPLCLGTVASGSGRRSSPAAATGDWVGLAVGLAALVGLSFTSHAASSRDGLTLTLEVVHQWSAALWFSGLLYLATDWRALGSDIGRFRTVRWVGGALIGISVLSGLAVAQPLVPSVSSAFASRYGQVLAGKSLFVLAILALGLVVMIVPRRTSARRASGSLAAQGLLGLVVALFAAVLALMAAPGIVAPVSLAGIDLVDLVPLDDDAFGVDSGLIHLMTQPGRAGPQTVVVHLTNADGMPLSAIPTPEVEVLWTSLTNPSGTEVVARLRPDPTGSLFFGGADLTLSSWWRADVVITPPGGITSRAQFWLMLPDPATTGRGLEPASDAQARAVYERGLQSLTSLRTVRFAQRRNDGQGSLERSRAEVSADEPAAFADMTIDAAGGVMSQQRIIGDRRWIRESEGDWQAAEPRPGFTPTTWAETYDGATGFQLGPREEVNGESCQIVTFWRPGGSSSRDPTWFAWWVGLASGQVRREATISPGQYVVTNYRDFNAPLEITAPATAAPDPPAATPQSPQATPLATPTG